MSLRGAVGDVAISRPGTMLSKRERANVVGAFAFLTGPLLHSSLDGGGPQDRRVYASEDCPSGAARPVGTKHSPPPLRLPLRCVTRPTLKKAGRLRRMLRPYQHKAELSTVALANTPTRWRGSLLKGAVKNELPGSRPPRLWLARASGVLCMAQRSPRRLRLLAMTTRGE